MIIDTISMHLRVFFFLKSIQCLLSQLSTLFVLFSIVKHTLFVTYFEYNVYNYIHRVFENPTNLILYTYLMNVYNII